jgi:hypothetical protein
MFKQVIAIFGINGLLLLLLCAGAGRAQDSVVPSVESMPAAPAVDTVDVLPPAVPPRPLPPPPASAFMRPALTSPAYLTGPTADLLKRSQPAAFETSAAFELPVKPPLSWRSRALDLNSDSQAPCRVLAGSCDEATLNLLSALPQFNLKVGVLNSAAGELLAVSVDPNNSQKIVFTINEMPEGTVTIKAAAFPSTKQGATLVQTLLQSLNTTASGRGTL